MKRNSTVTWKGSGKEGSGTITTQSKALDKAPYAWNTRFENNPGTNPEELIAAAHAGCFTMKLSFLLQAAGFKAEVIETTSEITMDNDGIKSSHLTVTAEVPGMEKDKFLECAKNAKENCPVSRALNLSITMEASLKEEILK